MNRPADYGTAAIHAAYLARYAAYADACDSPGYKKLAQDAVEHIAFALGYELVKRGEKQEAA